MTLFARHAPVQHVKTGGVYVIVETPIRARIEAGDVPAYLYRGQDGKVWARPQSEMEDGRFIDHDGCVPVEPSDAKTYPRPTFGWTCYHCGETHLTPGGAADHFDASQDAEPGCMIRVKYGDERGLLMEFRKAEETIKTLRRENEELRQLGTVK